MESLLGLIGVAVLIVANGFFVAAEFALVSVRRTQLDQAVSEGNAGARAVRRQINHLDAILSACQVGITLASLALGWVGEPAIAKLIEPPLAAVLPEEALPLSARAISAIVGFSIITILHIVLGEQAPKTLAIQRAFGTALFVTGPLNLFYQILRPAIWLLNTLSNAVLGLIGLKGTAGHEPAYGADEIILMVEASRRGGQIKRQEAEIVSRALEIEDIHLAGVMVPRPRVAAVAIRATVPEVLDVMRSALHTRVPVYDGTIDSLVGVIHLKDIAFLSGPTAHLAAADLMRPILRLPESLPISQAIRQMRENGSYLAAVVDEFGGTAGIVTMEDLLEEVVGPIRDEFDREEKPAIVKEEEGTFVVDGTASIHEVNHVLDLDVPEETVSTIGGWIVTQLGHLPEPGEEVEGAGASWQVLDVVGHRVGNVRVRLHPNGTGDLED